MMALMTYWKMAWLRAIIYMLFVGGTTFLGQTETWSDATWHDLGTFLRTRLVFTCCIASFGTLLAFLDTTMGQLRNGKTTIGTGDTQQITKV